MTTPADSKSWSVFSRVGLWLAVSMSMPAGPWLRCGETGLLVRYLSVRIPDQNRRSRVPRALTLPVIYEHTIPDVCGRVIEKETGEELLEMMQESQRTHIQQ